MSRPAHLERRGAVYYVRFRIPNHLIERLGKSDFRRTLGTKDYRTACRRCAAVTAWFERATEGLGEMVMLDRTALEEAANAYFAHLVREVDLPRELPDDNYDAALAFQIEASENEAERLTDRLTAQSYTDADFDAARSMLNQIGVMFDELDRHDRFAALNHVVRAKRQQMRFLLHGLQAPASRFVPDDDMFGTANTTIAAHAYLPNVPRAPRVVQPDLTLGTMASKYNDYLLRTERQGSTRDETARVLRWLQEEIDPATPVETITHENARTFRDCLLALGTGAQGRNLPFRQRVALPGQENLKFVTRQRYWRFATKFFRWLEAEYRIPDPTKGLLFEGGRNELRRSPDPFSMEELRRFLSAPLFSGYQSSKRLLAPGDCFIRNGHWWSGAIMIFAGLRAGDIAQLLPSDFRFNDEVPHFVIQPGKLPEGVNKRSKFGPRTHVVPLHPALLELGIREFVEGRAKQKPNRRLLYDLGLGEHRMSTGMTKFWSRFLHKFDLFRPGRATHVHRHTVIET